MMKKKIQEFIMSVKDIELPENVKFTITVDEVEFDNLIISKIGKAVSMNCIQVERDGKLFEIVVNNETKLVNNDLGTVFL